MRPTSLNLNLSPRHSPSSSNSFSTARIQSFVKNSSVNWLKNNQRISFYGTDYNDFKKFEIALNKIESTEIGRTLLDNIELTSRLKSEKLVIHLNSAELGVIAHCDADAENFIGTSSDFHCNLNQAEYNEGQGIDTDDFYSCIVFHELLHVLHNLNGVRLQPQLFNQELHMHSPLLLEEARTVGLGCFSEEVLSEKKFREKIGVPKRTSYAHESTLINDDGTVTHGFQ